MAKWSNALPLTACCLSSLPGFEEVRMLWWFSPGTPSLTTDLSRNMAERVTIIKYLKFQIPIPIIIFGNNFLLLDILMGINTGVTFKVGKKRIKYIPNI